MKLISLFSGAGISDVGFHQAGYECLAQVEIDKTASSVRRRHFPDCEHHQDIHEFSAIRFRGTADVVAGGFPCQDYSVAGNRAGLAGDRGALWWEMLRVIREAEPAYVWGENVPGILSADQGQSFRTIIGSLVELGYSVAWRVLDLRYFGVPQRRRRVFIVGTRVAGSSRGRAGVRIFEPDCLPWNLAESREEGQDNPAIVGTLSAGGGGKGGGTTDGNETSFLVPHAIDLAQVTSWANRSTPSTTCSTLAAQSQMAVLEPAIVGTLAANAGGLTRPAGNANELDFCVPEFSQTLMAKGNDPYDPSLMTYVPVCLKGAAIGRRPEAGPQFGETLEGECYTLNTREVHAVTSGARVRRLLPVECERLMGLPDGYTEFGHDGKRIADSARYRMLGNGWSVPQARWLAERFKD